MSETHIDHEAARDCANEAVEFYANNLLANGYRLSNAEQRDYLVSTAYLDLQRQLNADRARVDALADIAKRLRKVLYELGHKDIAVKVNTQINDILDASDNAHAQGDEG